MVLIGGVFGWGREGSHPHPNLFFCPGRRHLRRPGQSKGGNRVVFTTIISNLQQQLPLVPLPGGGFGAGPLAGPRKTGAPPPIPGAIPGQQPGPIKITAGAGSGDTPNQTAPPPHSGFEIAGGSGLRVGIPVVN